MLTINDIDLDIDFDVEDSLNNKNNYRHPSKEEYSNNNIKRSYDEWSKKCKKSMIV